MSNNEDIKNKVNPADPSTIPKFVDNLPKPSLATAICPCNYNGNVTFYDICMKEAFHRFHRFFPFTRFWGYDGMYPGPTIEVMKDTPVHVKWTNSLPNRHLLPIDHTLHSTVDTPDVRTVVHLHGANVEAESDGNPEAWYTRNYEFVGSKFTKQVYEYTNHQPGTTLWYHDHTIGITRLNVYSGLAGFYIIRDQLENRLNLPKGEYEYPIMIQDKTFNSDGSLYYPSEPTPPNGVNPSVVPAFFANTIVVNGKLWPFLNVEPRKYRFRMINACNGRPLVLKLSNDGDFHQIGTDGGFIHHTTKINSFSLDPSERIDLIIDFSELEGEEIILENNGFASDENTSIIMKFKVCLPLKCPDTSTIPHQITPEMHLDESLATKTRNLSVSQSTDEFGRQLFLLGNRMYSDPATEKPLFDSIEIWNIVNTFPFPHPIHVHLVQFFILDRIPYDVQLYNTTGDIKYTGPPEKPLSFETGYKDTCRAEGGKVTRIIMHFKDFAGDYAWHCHILEHEDHDMMRPIRVLKE